jgi:hypothetical protein
MYEMRRDFQLALEVPAESMPWWNAAAAPLMLVCIGNTLFS